MRVLDCLENCVSGSLVLFKDNRVCSCTAAAVVAEGNEVNSTVLEDLFIFLCHRWFYTCTLHAFPCPDGISSSGLYVNEEVVVPVFFKSVPDIGRVAGVGVELSCCKHTAYLDSRNHHMGKVYGQSACHKFVVGSCVFYLLFVFSGFKIYACSHERHMKQHVDFVECKPVFDNVSVVLKQNAAVLDKGIDHAAVTPAAPALDKGNRGVKMVNCYKRLYSVFSAFLEQFPVKADTGLVGFVIIAVRQDAGPGNGHAVTLESHFGKEADVLLEVMIMVNCLLGRICETRLAGQHFALSAAYLHTFRSVGDHIHTGQSTTVFVICTFTLIGCSCATPEKACRKGFLLHAELLVLLFIF